MNPEFYLKRPIKYTRGIGPKYQKLLEKLEIKTVKDLLYHFPFRYEDYSKKCTIKEAEINQTVSVSGILGKVTNIISPYGKKLTIATLTDHTGSINIVWFNQHYLKKILKENRTYTVSGKISYYNSKKCFFSPEYEEGEGGLTTGRLISIYPETAGLSSKWLRIRNNDVLNELRSYTNGSKDLEFMPEEILREKNFPYFLEALYKIHFPQNLGDAEIAKKRFAFEEIFLELLKVEKRKIEWQKKKNGCVILHKPFSNKIQELISSLPFTLTNSQINALENIFADLEDQNPMNRLLEGDVGSGKTVVSAIAAYLAYLNGYKTALMAPTELLSQQHYETYNKLLCENFDKSIKIIQKTSSKSTKIEQDFDIIIGTHSLLYSKQNISKLGLVIIDEQHRFGVEQRTLLLNMVKENLVPNMLSMTATPIPRTLALTIYGDLDITVIKPPIQNTRKVVTKVVKEKNREKLYQWIKIQNKQTFIVCPFISQSANEDFENIKAAEKEFVELQKILPAGKMRLIHGKLKSKEKENAIKEFRTQKITYLVSTPVVEVGIDVPDASIMVIESAERYGLASLHQLRGRVGRVGQQGFCFLVYTGNSQKSLERLKLMENCDDGLELAELDLKMRGQGDIFGTMQSGIKNFKVANIFDTEFLEDVKTQAQKYIKTLDQYPKLKEKVEESGKYVGQN